MVVLICGSLFLQFFALRITFMRVCTVVYVGANTLIDIKSQSKVFLKVICNAFETVIML